MTDKYLIGFDEVNNQFYIKVDDEIIAEMTTTIENSQRIIIEHTIVSPKYSGKGLGKLLVVKAVEVARQNGLKITPRCEYAKSVFEKTTEYRDVSEL